MFALVVTGMLNKQIACALGIGEKTVKVHRARVMEKMRAGSVAELVRLADEAGVIMPGGSLTPGADSATVTADALVLVWVSETAMALRQYRASSC